MIERHIGRGISRKLLILINCMVFGIIPGYGVKLLERCSPKILVLSCSGRASDPSDFLMVVNISYNCSMFLVIFYNDPSLVFSDFNFVSKRSFLYFWITFLMLLNRLLKIDLSEGCLGFSQRE